MAAGDLATGTACSGDLALVLHAHLPWQRRAEFLPRILELGLAPEIAFKGPELDDLPAAGLNARTSPDPYEMRFHNGFHENYWKGSAAMPR